MFGGIDQSLRGTGIAIVDLKGHLVESVLVNTSNLRGVERLRMIRDQVRATFTRHTVSAAAVEGYAYTQVGRVFELGEVGGVVKVAAVDAGAALTVVTPTQLKKYAAGKGHAKKSEIIAAVLAHWGVSMPDDDDNLCDAFVLAQVVRSVVKGDYKTRSQAEVAHAIRTAVDEPEDTEHRATRSRTKLSL